MWKIENYSAEIWLETCIVLFKYRFSCEKKKNQKWYIEVVQGEINI